MTATYDISIPPGGFPKIDPEFKAKWLEALRSGKYRQTTGTLRRSTSSGKYSFCCIGVACNVISNRRWTNPVPDDQDSNKFRWGWDEYHNGETGLPFLQDEVVGEALASLNDDCGASLAEIADWIEVNL